MIERALGLHLTRPPWVHLQLRLPLAQFHPSLLLFRLLLALNLSEYLGCVPFHNCLFLGLLLPGQALSLPLTRLPWVHLLVRLPSAQFRPSQILVHLPLALNLSEYLVCVLDQNCLFLGRLVLTLNLFEQASLVRNQTILPNKIREVYKILPGSD